MAHSKIMGFVTLWIAAVVLGGGIMMSFHQPFRPPDSRILELAEQPLSPNWRAIHFLSGSCGCSQKVMQHLLERHTVNGIAEQVIVVDGPEPYLPGSRELMVELQHQGFAVKHLAETDIPQDSGLHGVPLLVVASPSGHVVYAGGYGSNSHEDATLLQQISFGQTPRPLPVTGCAIGSRLRRQADPFHLKY